MLSLEQISQLAEATPSKIVLLVLDGLGGVPRPETGLTELETARTPNLDRLAREGICGMAEPVGVGITPLKVLGTPKPEASVMISRTLGAFLGGTMRGAHQGFESRAPLLMTPPNSGSGAGSCLPLIVVVALGEPSSPVICWFLTGMIVHAVTRRAMTASNPKRNFSFMLNSFFLFIISRLISALSEVEPGAYDRAA